MSKDGRTWLSHTGLEKLERCPRCFWLQYKRKIYQPEGIVSRLANRYDAVLKSYFDIYRPIGKLPPLVEGKLDGKLQNPFQEKYFARIDDNYGFFGKLDEALVNSKEELAPIDFKTSSSDPRERETLPAYKSQIDDYVFLMKENNKSVSGDGYLIYFFPDHGKELHKSFPMIMHIVKLEGDPQRTSERISKAISVLEAPMPKPKEDCPFCAWREVVDKELSS